MALFSRKNDAKETKDSAATPVVQKTTAGRDLSSVLVRPQVTEKAMYQGEKNVYTFEVARSATKFDVRDAVKEFFGVTPVKVNIVNKSPRQFKSRARARTMTERGMKKAYVYLKEGDSISLV